MLRFSAVVKQTFSIWGKGLNMCPTTHYWCYVLFSSRCFKGFHASLGPDQRLRPLHWVDLILLVWHCLHFEQFSEGGNSVFIKTSLLVVAFSNLISLNSHFFTRGCFTYCGVGAQRNLANETTEIQKFLHKLCSNHIDVVFCCDWHSDPPCIVERDPKPIWVFSLKMKHPCLYGGVVFL